MLVHAVAVIVIAVWILAIIGGGLSENPNKGVVQKWIDNARMERENDGR